MAIQSNTVVRLPTAAPRKVRQQYGKSSAYRKNLFSLPQFPTLEARLNATPYARECRKTARLMANADHRAAMMLAVQIFAALDAKQQGRVIGKLLGIAAKTESDTPREALAWVEWQNAPASRQCDIRDAMAEIVSGEGE